jgi:hypothetical protein
VAEGGGAEPSAVFRITDGKGEYRLSLYGAADGADHVIESDRRRGRFRLAAFVAEQILVEAEALLPTSAEDAAEAAVSEAEPADAGAAVLQQPAPADEHDH